MENSDGSPSRLQLINELKATRARLAETEETLRAIRTGEVDALVVLTPQGKQVFTLQGANRTYCIIFEEMQ